MPKSSVAPSVAVHPVLVLAAPARTVSPAAPATATPAPLTAWRPIILDTCGKHASDVLLIAYHLHHEGPAAVGAIAAALRQDRRWVMRATALGREIGLFTLRSGAHNAHTFTVVSTPPEVFITPPGRAI